MERFRPDKPLELLTPLEWSQAETLDGAGPGGLRVWAVDTNGHFYAALTCRVARTGATAGEAGCSSRRRRNSASVTGWSSM